MIVRVVGPNDVETATFYNVEDVDMKTRENRGDYALLTFEDGTEKTIPAHVTGTQLRVYTVERKFEVL